MTLYEVVFKATHDCPFCNLSKKLPSLRMFVWCNREHEIIEIIVDNDEERLTVLDELSRVGRKVAESSQHNNVHLMTTRCSCTMENSIGRNIDALDLLHISPVFYEKGWEYYRVIAFKHGDLGRLIHRLEEMSVKVEIMRKVPFDGFVASSLTLTADSLFSSLTEKQMNAMLTAHEKGYYGLPRKATLTDIARMIRVPRTTFEEHLRKAENKLILSLIPYLQIFKMVSPDRREKLRFHY